MCVYVCMCVCDVCVLDFCVCVVNIGSFVRFENWTTHTHTHVHAPLTNCDGGWVGVKRLVSWLGWFGLEHQRQ